MLLLRTLAFPPHSALPVDRPDARRAPFHRLFSRRRGLGRSVFTGLALWFTLPAAEAAQSVTRHGITWTFAQDERTGQFINGDWWVVGPVTITQITPFDAALDDDVDVHGSVVNPTPVLRSPYTQSFDSRLGTAMSYRRAGNVACQLPLKLAPGDALLSTRSREALTGERPYLLDAAVLTVVETAPAPGSFRPPYAGPDREIPGHIDDLDLSIFRSLPRVSNAPSPSSFDKLFQQPLIDLIVQWPNSDLKAANGGSYYGRDIAREVGDAVLTLNLAYPDEQKLPLVIRLVQRGIDTYGLARAGMVWQPNGGHNNGRKLPLLIAARALNHGGMLAYGDARKHFIFQEDTQYWFLTEDDVRLPRGRPNFSAYTPDMIGLAEWAPNPITERNLAGSEWSRAYRHVNGSVNTGMVLAAELMGLRPLWNWDPLFVYTSERFWPKESTTPTSPVVIPSFHRAMWRAYRDPKAATVLAPMAAADVSPVDRLINLSTRGRVSPEAGLVAGFVLQGRSPRTMLLRAVGAGLRDFGVNDALTGTQLVVYRDGTRLAQSGGASAAADAKAIAAASARVGAFGLSEAGDDAVLLLNLSPGSYTAHVSGTRQASGVVLVELYDAGGPGEGGSSTRLINLSTRGHAGGGQSVLTSGLAIGGQQPKRVLIRALGPGLQRYGVTGVLADPRLTLLRGEREVGSNDDWAGAGEVAAAAATVGAFPLPAGSKDAAMVVTLPPGNYTAQVAGRPGTSGMAMIEVYEVR